MSTSLHQTPTRPLVLRPDFPRDRLRVQLRSHYTPPRLVLHGRLGTLVRGASWKGIDSIGELDPDQSYPG